MAAGGAIVGGLGSLAGGMGGGGSPSIDSGAILQAGEMLAKGAASGGLIGGIYGEQGIGAAQRAQQLSRQDLRPYQMAGYDALAEMSRRMGMSGYQYNPQQENFNNVMDRVEKLQRLGTIAFSTHGSVGPEHATLLGDTLRDYESELGTINAMLQDSNLRLNSAQIQDLVNSLEANTGSFHELFVKADHAEQLSQGMDNPWLASSQKPGADIWTRDLYERMRGDNRTQVPRPGQMFPEGSIMTDIANNLIARGQQSISSGEAAPGSIQDTAAYQPLDPYSAAEVQDKLRASPDYQFRFNEGMDGVTRNMSALGMRNSGNALNELMTRGQDMASQEFSASQQRLAQIAGLGAPAAGQLSGQAQQGGQFQSGLLGQMGDNLSNSILSAAQARSSALVNSTMANFMNDQGKAAAGAGRNQSIFGGIGQIAKGFGSLMGGF